MKIIENASFETFWQRVGKYIGIGDSVKYDENEDGEEVVTFYNSVGCPLSSYNLDRNVETQY